MQGQQGYVLLAPAVPGNMSLLNLHGRQDWAILMACDPTVGIRNKVRCCAQGCCSGKGFFILKAVDTSRLLVNTYGRLLRYELRGSGDPEDREWVHCVLAQRHELHDQQV